MESDADTFTHALAVADTIEDGPDADAGAPNFSPIFRRGGKIPIVLGRLERSSGQGIVPTKTALAIGIVVRAITQAPRMTIRLANEVHTIDLVQGQCFVASSGSDTAYSLKGTVELLSLTVPYAPVAEALGMPAVELIDTLAPLQATIFSCRTTAVILADMWAAAAKPSEDDHRFLDQALILLTMTAIGHAKSDHWRVSRLPLSTPFLEPDGPIIDERISRTLAYIEGHLSEDLSIHQLANVAGMSATWFQTCFRTATGWTVHAYVLERRCERVRSLLLHSKVSLAYIWEMAGFSDQAHMTRAFRKKFGTTPSRLRKSVGVAPNVGIYEYSVLANGTMTNQARTT